MRQKYLCANVIKAIFTVRRSYDCFVIKGCVIYFATFMFNEPFNCYWLTLLNVNIYLYKIHGGRGGEDYLLTGLMFDVINGIAPSYFSEHTDMKYDMRGYGTRGSGSINVYLSNVPKDIFVYNGSYFGIGLYNPLADFVKTNRYNIFKGNDN